MLGMKKHLLRMKSNYESMFMASIVEKYQQWSAKEHTIPSSRTHPNSKWCRIKNACRFRNATADGRRLGLYKKLHASMSFRQNEYSHRNYEAFQRIKSSWYTSKYSQCSTRRKNPTYSFNARIFNRFFF